MLEVESGGCIFRCRKNQTNERKTSTLYSLLKTVLPWRSTDAITGHQLRAPTQETSRTVIGRRSTCRTALPCSRFLVRASLFLVRRSSVLVRRLINVRSVPVIAAVHQRRTLDLESCSSSHSCLLVVLPVVQKEVTLS